MEDMLDVYERPYDPRFPQVCTDELSRQLLGEVRPPLPTRPGRVARIDYEYERRGVRNIFLAVESLRGWRHAQATERRTKRDWAHFMRELADVHYANAERIVVVLDNLNTHGPASFYPRLLAQHRRDRVERAPPPVPRPPPLRSGHPRCRGRRVASQPQRRPHAHRLALHYRRCQNQTETSLPIALAVAQDYTLQG